MITSFDIATMLQTSGIGTLASDIFVGKEPDYDGIDDAIVTVLDTGGFKPNPAYLRDEPTVQVRVRGAPGDYLGTFGKAQSIKDVLLGADTQVINGSRYVRFSQIGDITPLGYDTNNRPLLVSNWALVREMDTGGNRQSL